MAKGDGIANLMDNLATLTGDNKDISLLLSSHRGPHLRWTVWSTEDMTNDPQQMGAGETIVEALKSAYNNTVRDIFDDEEK